MEERIQNILSHAGVASRRKASEGARAILWAGRHGGPPYT